MELIKYYPSGTAPLLLGDDVDQSRLPEDACVQDMYEAAGIPKTEPVTMGILCLEWNGHAAGSGVIIHEDSVYIVG